MSRRNPEPQKGVISRALRQILLLALLALFAVPSLAQDHKKLFSDGFKAIEDRKYARATELLRRAIAQQATEEKTKVLIYGGRYVDYLPHYYLGLALAEQGDCAGAVREWDLSEQQGVVKGGSRQLQQAYADLLSRRGNCQTQIAATTPDVPPKTTTTTPKQAAPDPAVLAAVRRARSAIDSADRAATTLERQWKAPESQPILANDLTLATKRAAAVRDLDAARRQVAKDDIDKATAEQAEQRATQASRAFADLGINLDRQIAEAKKQAAEVVEISEMKNNVPPPTTTRPDPARVELVQDIQRLRAEGNTVLAESTSGGNAEIRLRNYLSDAEKASVETSAADLRRLKANLERATEDLRVAIARDLEKEAVVVADIPPSTVPPTTSVPQPAVDLSPEEIQRLLTEGANSLLAGDYAAVIETLRPLDPKNDPALAAIYLLRASAQFSLARLEDNPSLRDGAAQAVARCAELAPNLELDPRFFSPAFSRFYAENR